MSTKYAGVYLLDAPFSLDREYDYMIPEGINITPGDFVGLPFGNGNRRRIALVTSIKDTTEVPEGKVKPILAKCAEGLHLDGEMLEIWRFLRSTTLCTTSDAIHAMIPSAALSKLEEYYSPTEKAPTKAILENAQAMMIFNLIVSRGRIGEEALKYRFGVKTAESVEKLLKAGCIRRELEVCDPSAGKSESVYSLAVDEETAEIHISGGLIDGKKIAKIKSEGQILALRKLMECREALSSLELREGDIITTAHLSALIKKGLISEEKRSVNRDLILIHAHAEAATQKRELVLSDEQSEALSTLTELYSSGEPRAALLEGVTGSGKTSVMLALIDRVLESGRDVILLLPEIALTPQTLSIFCARYGEEVALLHSGMSAGERQDSYNRIKNGAARLVIGTRSAIFAPTKNLGLVIIDEEQEHTYKSDSSPRYHARDIARLRCAYSKALMLLASATPSLESRKKAEDGAYTLIRLTKRYGNAVLPEVVVADMRGEARTGNLTPIGAELSAALVETFERGEQSILFLNRRGYNNYVSCAVCGEAIKCPSCSVSMTYHTRRGNYEAGELVCHWCGRRMPLPTECPECKSEHLIRMGYGTQRVEQELSLLLPDAKILRMDTDTTQTKNSYRELLGKFKRHEADILLGTQMVTKGHDFPDVTLVGVLLADASLYYDDYRAEERTFALLTQVIGRAGRRDKAGRAIIQTNNPDHEVIELASMQDYETFYKRTIRLRRALVFPPFCDIVLLTLTGKVESDVLKASSVLNENLRALTSSEKYRDLPFILFGPFEAPVYRVDSRYRMRMVVKCKLGAQTRRLFAQLLSEFPAEGASAPTLSIDFNPTNL
ncbi:MAG: primosomal protein N' [Clostridia bacterium]|nr:primosomal protein N' [Clostridia bacterium]